MQSAAFLPIPRSGFSPRSLSTGGLSARSYSSSLSSSRSTVPSSTFMATGLTNRARYPSPQAASSSTEAAARASGVGKRAYLFPSNSAFSPNLSQSFGDHQLDPWDIGVRRDHEGDQALPDVLLLMSPTLVSLYRFCDVLVLPYPVRICALGRRLSGSTRVRRPATIAAPSRRRPNSPPPA